MRMPSLPFIGFLQALGVVLYTMLVSVFMSWLGRRADTLPDQFGAPVFLTLLVFSAAVTGLSVFGYPVYLAFQSRAGDALRIIAFTLFFCACFIAFGTTIVFFVL
jgi:hypothetical protein